jgi:uncharacterized membrane protein YeaQ/YmgE (transglycosylase-associated protein family)
MNLILWLIAGAVIGYIASRIMGTNSQQGLLLDIVVGVVGAFLAGWFLTPLFGIGTINQNDFSLPALLVSLLGAVLLLAIVKLLTGRRLRSRNTTRGFSTSKKSICRPSLILGVRLYRISWTEIIGDQKNDQ